MPVATLAATLINKKWIKEMGDSLPFSLILVAFNMFIAVLLHCNNDSCNLKNGRVSLRVY